MSTDAPFLKKFSVKAMDKSAVGKKGEDFCASHYENQGFEITERNYHCRFGEIDVIAENESTLAFIEVKTRSENQMLEAKDAVTLSKQKKIILTAMDYISKNNKDKILRFDVFEVIHKDGRLVKFRKTEGAFEADERVLGDYHF